MTTDRLLILIHCPEPLFGPLFILAFFISSSGAWDGHKSFSGGGDDRYNWIICSITFILFEFRKFYYSN